MDSAHTNVDRDAEAAMRKLYNLLEATLKRHQPRDYLLFAAAQLTRAFQDPKLLAQIRPHHLLHSIEVNCACARGQNRDPVDRNRLARVMNAYYGHRDPLQEGLLNDGKPDLLFLVMHREQIELQHEHSQDELARNQSLFVVDDPMPELHDEFQSELGLSFDEFIRLCFFAMVAAGNNESHLFARSVVTDCTFHSILPDHVNAFWQLSCITPKKISQRYREKRNGTKPQFHSLIRSVFLQFPLVDFEDGTVLAPHPPLLLRHSGQCLYRLARTLPSFGSQFGGSVQRYVWRVLDSVVNKHGLYTDSELEEISTGKSCDFALELDDAILLIESKAVSFVADFLTEKAILNDGSTTKVAAAILQLYTSANDLATGVFDALGVDKEKPVVGIVATFGELPFSNSDWYRDEIIRKRAEPKLPDCLYPCPAMPRWPVVVSLETLELLATALNSGMTVTQLCAEKDAAPFVQVGDWDTFLKSKLCEVEADQAVVQLPFVKEQSEAFWRSLGVDPSADRT